ncbi:hypothetical protein GA0070609_3274 [Micromonospora echinaurantiaca]|uniref:Uncharacterized protein n=1 Tax=Micromonospora echinaurantiaca TaxID=47857 RepID=A0A1C5IGM6_9ACTN|nr:hypothetical protein GA0070609_3274 [Micromonospora echinaurantiaca]
MLEKSTTAAEPAAVAKNWLGQPANGVDAGLVAHLVEQPGRACG